MHRGLVHLTHTEELELLQILHGLVASVTPEEVQGVVVEGVAGLIPFAAAGFSAGDTTTFKLHWGAVHNDNGWQAEYTRWEAQDFLKLAFVRDLTPRALRVSDLMPVSSFLRSSPLYHEFKRSYGLGFTMACAGKVNAGQWSGLSIMREGAHEFSPHERDLLTLLTRPYVAAVGRALEMQGVEREVEALLARLGTQGRGALLVDGVGRVVHADDGGRDLLFRLQGDGHSPGALLPKLLYGPWRAWWDGLQGITGGPPSRVPGPAVPLPGMGATLDFTLLEADRFGLAGPLTLVRLRRLGPAVPPSWERVLSPRELEVARAVLAGQRNRAIGEELFISEWTVRRHLTTIFRKLDLRGRKALLAAAGNGDGHGDDGRQP